MLPEGGVLPQISAEHAAAAAKIFQGKVFNPNCVELRRLFKALGTHVILDGEKTTARINWPPLGLLPPFHYPVYPQGDTSPIVPRRLAFSLPRVRNLSPVR